MNKNIINFLMKNGFNETEATTVAWTIQGIAQWKQTHSVELVRGYAWKLEGQIEVMHFCKAWKYVNRYATRMEWWGN